MKKLNFILRAIVVCGCCFVISGTVAQDAEDIADDRLDNLDMQNAENLANAARNSEYLNRGKGVGNDTRGRVEEMGGTEPETQVGVNYTDEQGEELNQFYTQGRQAREDSNVKIDRDSSLLRAEKSITAGASGLGDSYEDCVDLSTDATVESTIANCSIAALYEEVRFECTKSGFNVCENMTARRLNGDRGQLALEEIGIILSGVVTDDPELRYTVIETIGEFNEPPAEGERCETTEYTYQLVVPAVGQLVAMGLKMESFTGWVQVTVNDETVFENGDSSACDAGSTLPFTSRDDSDAEAVDIFSRLQGEGNWIRVRYSHPENATLRFSLDGYGRSPCDENLYLTQECPAEIAEEVRERAVLVEETCIQPVDNVVYMDRVIETDCIQWRQQYELVDGPFYPDSGECAAYAAQGCDLIASQCTVEGQEFCPEYQRTYRCDTAVPAEGSETMSMCADTIACRDGECAAEFQEVPDNEKDFKEASIWLEILGGMDADIDLARGDATFFTGKALRCEDYIAAYGNCCADSGWGVAIGLQNCSREEIDLGRAKQQDRVVHVGNYREEIDLLITDVTLVDYKVYCVYDSELAKVFIEQANAQLNRGYGSGENPDCRGVTVDEMSNLNFDNMDFSELYADAGKDANTTPADVDQLIQSINGGDPCQYSASGECQ